MRKMSLSVFMTLGLVLTCVGISYAQPPSTVPEPTTWVLMAAGAAGILGYGFINKRKK